MKTLTAEEILGADDLPKELVDCPEWGGSFYIKTINGKQRDKFEESIQKRKGKETSVDLTNFRAKMVALTACDGNSKLIFSESQAKALGEKSAMVLDRCFAVSQRLNGFSNNDVEELTKNSETVQNDTSTSS